MNSVLVRIRSTLLRFRWWIAGVLVLGVAAYLVHRLHGMDYATPVTLPRVDAGEVRDAGTWQVVHLTVAGDVLYEGRPHTLDELSAVLSKDERQVLLCADHESTALNFLYLCAVFQDCGHECFWIAVDDGWRRAVLPAHTGWTFGMVVRIYGGPGAVTSGCGFDVPGSPRPASSLVRIAPGDDWFVDADDLEEAIEDAWEAIGVTEEEWEAAHGPIIPFHSQPVVAPCTEVPFQCVAEALAAYHDAGVEWVHVRSIEAHPWVRRQHSLERPSWTLSPGQLLFQGQEVGVTLPVAPRTAGSESSTSSISLTLTSHGRIHTSSHHDPLTLAELRIKLDNFARFSTRRLKDAGRPASEAVARLRIDKDAPWQHVQWILSLLRERGVTRIAFVALAAADASYGESEAAALGVERTSSIPLPPGFVDSELLVVLARNKRIPTDTVPIAIRRGKGGAVLCEMAGNVTTRIGDLTLPPDQDVAFDVEPAVPAKYVIAVLSRVDKASRVYFAAKAGPPASAEDAPALPPPD